MPTTVNTAGRNAILNAISALYNGGTLTIRSGTPPGPNATATGTVLATVTLPNPAFAAASGTAARTGTWSDASADATGTAGHFRVVATGGAVFEGTISATGGSGDMELSTISMIAATPFTITAFTLSLTNA